MQIGDVVAERVLERRGAGTVLLRVGRPTEAPGGDWRCPFQIVGLVDDEVLEAFGVDSLQALALCLEMISARIAGDAAADELTWLGGSDLSL